MLCPPPISHSSPGGTPQAPFISQPRPQLPQGSLSWVSPSSSEQMGGSRALKGTTQPLLCPPRCSPVYSSLPPAASPHSALPPPFSPPPGAPDFISLYSCSCSPFPRPTLPRLGRPEPTELGGRTWGAMVGAFPPPCAPLRGCEGASGGRGRFMQGAQMAHPEQGPPPHRYNGGWSPGQQVSGSLGLAGSNWANPLILGEVTLLGGRSDGE